MLGQTDPDPGSGTEGIIQFYGVDPSLTTDFFQIRMDEKIILIGMPGAGKTTSLAALWFSTLCYDASCCANC